MSILLSTTGRAETVVLEEINGLDNNPVTFEHPVENFDLLSLTDIDDLRRCESLRTAIKERTVVVSAGGVTLNTLDFVGLGNAVQSDGPPQLLFRHNGNQTLRLDRDYQTVPFPSLIRQDSAFKYDAGEIIFTLPGWYRVQAQITIDTSSGRRQYSENALFLNKEILDGSLSYGYHRKNPEGVNTTYLQYLVEASSEDVLRVMSREPENGYQLNTVRDACSLMIERVS